MFMASRGMGSPPLGVILTLRRPVFIWGETEVMVPWTMVPTMCVISAMFFLGFGASIGRVGKVAYHS